MSTTNPVPRIYRAVIDDVIKNVRESFLNEGIDEQVLLELKQLWENKLLQSHAIDFMPSDVNVRVSLTYPHNVPQMQGIDQPGQAQPHQPHQPHQQAAIHQSVPQPMAQPTSSAPAGHLMQNTTGQLVYVSTHPTLGNVGPMSGAAAQAAMALQGAADARRIIPQQIRQIQGDTASQATIYQSFQGRGSIGPSVILTPAQAAQAQAQLAAVAAAHQQQQQQQQLQQQAHQQLQQQVQAQSQTQDQQDQKPVLQHIIQVDGAMDCKCENCDSFKPKNLKSRIKDKSNIETLRAKSQSGNGGSGKTNEIGRFKNMEIVLQLDGANDSDESDDIDGDDDDEDYDNIPVAPAGAGTNTESVEAPLEEEEPLNSEDDVSDDDPTDLFDTDNVVVCQYDKIARTRNRWKFHLKDGIMNLKSKDYVFHKANGDSEW